MFLSTVTLSYLIRRWKRKKWKWWRCTQHINQLRYKNLVRLEHCWGLRLKVFGKRILLLSSREEEEVCCMQENILIMKYLREDEKSVLLHVVQMFVLTVNHLIQVRVIYSILSLVKYVTNVSTCFLLLLLKFFLGSPSSSFSLVLCACQCLLQTHFVEISDDENRENRVYLVDYLQRYSVKWKERYFSVKWCNEYISFHPSSGTVTRKQWDMERRVT